MYADSKFITFRGLAIHYRVLFPKGPVRHRALLVASPGLSTYNWRYVAPELRRAGCLCVLCDLPGFGLSMLGPGVPHRQDVRAGLLWGLLDEIDLLAFDRMGTWNLIAHGSASGTIAAMALQHPENVGSMTMVSPMLYPPAFVEAFRPLIRSRLGDRLIRRWYQKNLRHRPSFERLIPKIYGCRLPGEVLERLRTPFTRLGSDEALQKLLLDGYHVETERLKDLFAPVMVLWGGRDRLLGGEIPKRLIADLPDAEFHRLKRAGHCPMETDSRAVCDFLRGWIRAVWT